MFSGCHVTEKSLHFNDHVTWTCLPVSFVYIPLRKTLPLLYLLRQVCIRSPADGLKLKMEIAYHASPLPHIFFEDRPPPYISEEKTWAGWTHAGVTLPQKKRCVTSKKRLRGRLGWLAPAWHFWWYHVNKYRALRWNRSELAPARKSSRCHVNTPPKTHSSWPVENPFTVSPARITFIHPGFTFHVAVRLFSSR